jgi:archaellum biogenesis protein FlaJ (TadC family)
LLKTVLLLTIVYSVFGAISITVLSFSFIVFYPIQKAMARERNIETNLPFALTHMGAIAESGIPPYIIFKLISECEEYGELAKEMKKIVRNIETFGLDPLTSVKEVAKRTPSADLRQILLGFVTTTESGGDVRIYLRNAGQQALFDWKVKREKFLQQLSAYAEFYTGLLIAAPLFIISLFAVMNMIQPSLGGFNILDLTKISIYLIVPALNIGYIVFLKGVEVEM